MPKFLAGLDNLDKNQTNIEILSIGMIAELDAINLHEQMAARTNNSNIKILLNIAKEE